MATQEPDLRRWADAQGEQIVWYHDTFTGKSMDRAGWNRLTADVQAGKCPR